MGGGFATVTVDEGVLVRSADVNGFTLAELGFPPGFVQDAFEPELPYLALVLEGSLEKSFQSRAVTLGRGSALTMPVGAAHGAVFGPEGARIVIVKPRNASTRAARSFRRLAELRGDGFSWLAWRLAGELRASDAAAPLAAEGFALELLAAAGREAEPEQRRTGPRPRWLSSAEELLRSRIDECVRLGDLASAVGVHPAHLARSFRAHYGVSIGEFGRQVRLAWAARELARSDRPLCSIASRAGFADQSHFTRLFKKYVGVTPARYREETRIPA